jgi:hypothetical protein
MEQSVRYEIHEWCTVGKKIGTKSKSSRDRTEYAIAQFSKYSAGEIARLDYNKSLGYRFLARTDM